jgi:hypothetical protein
MLLSVHPYGIFVDLGCEKIPGKQLCGIVDIVDKVDEGTRKLPIDFGERLKVRETVKFQVIYYREYNREIDIALLK